MDTLPPVDPRLDALAPTRALVSAGLDGSVRDRNTALRHLADQIEILEKSLEPAEYLKFSTDTRTYVIGRHEIMPLVWLFRYWFADADSQAEAIARATGLAHTIEIHDADAYEKRR